MYEKRVVALKSSNWKDVYEVIKTLNRNLFVQVDKNKKPVALSFLVK